MAQILRNMGNILRDDSSGGGGGIPTPTPVTVSTDLRGSGPPGVVIDATKPFLITCTGQLKSSNGTVAGEMQLLASVDAFSLTSVTLDAYQTFSTTFQTWTLKGIVPAGYWCFLNTNNGTSASVAAYIKQPLA